MAEYSDFSATINHANSLLSIAFSLISKLPPNNLNLPPDAVAGLQDLHQWSETILKWVVAVSNNSTDKYDTVLQFEPATYFNGPLRTVHTQITRNKDISEMEEHALEMLDLVSKSPTPQKFDALLATMELYGYVGARTICHKSGFVSMFNGYELISEQEMLDHFHARRLHPRSPSKLADHFHTLISETKHQSNMITAENELLPSASNDNIIRWINSVIRNVESIRLANQWRELTDDHRGRLFDKVTSTLIIPGHDTSLWQQNNDSSSGSRARAHYLELIKRRIVLQDLYSRLGPTVLLDPSVLDIAADTLFCPSKFYHIIYPAISKELSIKDIIKNEYWRRRRFTLQVLKAISSSTVVNFVTEFLDETKPDGVGSIGDSNT
ncbi:hypothetical protein BT96DRAFT_1008368 [Gymnopus androsaceus JB14]|uniref:Uncharacterized protein n=1 Tax=Gymnopus androsaceus JB14 TaxID=1447944 RepID=A0A6A4GFB0_9AGAR|nr:hypothetical protein BT96DRAFT_1008368 [Gymnopus androsaceus JB14]